MKKIILKSITLRNFKGEEFRNTNFNSDVTTISGGNGLGKSRHFDAFMWLLFGKDVQDRKDYAVRTRNADGTLLHNVECSVTGVIDIDGQEITLKRELVEEWVKPSGKVDRILKGNHNECWWNGTPVKVNEFNARVSSIIEQSLFKMITNPLFFPNIDWKLQREQLFKLAGTITDSEIASKNHDFMLLLDKLTGKSLSDFKLELSAEKKRLKNKLKEIQPRIDQTQKMKPENEDFKAIEIEIEKADREIADIDKAIADVTAAIRKQYEKEQAKQDKANALKSECQQIIFKAKEEAQNAAFEANTKRRELENNIKDKKREGESVQKGIINGQVEIARIHRDIDKLKGEQDEIRKEWYKENGKQYDGGTICPHCGQELPESILSKAREVFNKAQADKCYKISEKGKRLGERIKEYETKVENINASIGESKKRIESLRKEVETLEASFTEITVFDVEVIVPENIPEWVSKQKEIADIEATILTDNSCVDTTCLQNQKNELNKTRDALKSKLSKRDDIASCEKEISQLEESGKKLAQQIAELEKEEYIVQEFTRTKIDECESRINGLFHNVTFQLFDKTFDGNIRETCVPIVGGVPFGAANTAGKINAGIDIINVLCKFYGVSAPIFLDNRESVNDIIPTESQIINLVVTNDKKLTIK